MTIEESPDSVQCRKRGRPRIRRRMGEHERWRCYAPQCSDGEVTGSVFLLPEEIELLRLIDLEGMDQEEAGAILGVSRRTIWKDIHEARMKVTDALVNGKVIEIRNCEVRIKGSCPKENEEICPRNNRVRCIRNDVQEFFKPGPEQ